jgi:UDP-N-acetylmuramyl pentapeptide phosphotransferase/UDP-N-acetylglucosamine-1-phosphate transferase
MILIQEFFSNIFALALFAAVLTFIISIKMYRIIIHTVTTRNLMEKPGNRKIHRAKTATHGGVGLFASFSLSILVFGLSIGLPQLDLIKLLALITATLILLFLGIKDDLIAISPKTKFIGQLIACIIIIFFADLRITSFDGLLGVGELPYAVSMLFTLFVYILIINAINLVDGIDGLAGAIATISSVAFGIFFLLNENFLLALVSFILFGSLLGFLLFNLSDKRKLFMGDSGSLFLGFLLAYQGISFLGLNQTPDALNPISNAPVMFLAILSFPLLDTLRVFVIRVKQKRSPFSPDCNHIHHRLLHIGLTHIQATMFVALSNILLIGLVLIIGKLNINVQLYLTVFVGSALYLSPFLNVFKKDIALEVDKTKPNNVISMKQVLASESPTQQAKPSFGLTMGNGVAHIETPAMNGYLEETGSDKVEKFQRKISANGFVVFKKILE